MAICTLLLGLVYLGLLPTPILDIRAELRDRLTLQVSLFLQYLAFLLLSLFTLHLFTSIATRMQLGWMLTIFAMFLLLIASILVAFYGAFGSHHWMFIVSSAFSALGLIEALWFIRKRVLVPRMKQQ